MTINIPLRVVAFVVYTVALLGGAFGISYAVFEWRHDDEAIDALAIEKKIDELEQAGAGPTRAELDGQKCEAALDAAGQALGRPPRSIDGRIELAPTIPSDIQELIDRYCD